MKKIFTMHISEKENAAINREKKKKQLIKMNL